MRSGRVHDKFDNIEEGQPMTYADYRALKSGRSVNKTNNNADDWLCPVCKQPKSKFLLES